MFSVMEINKAVPNAIITPAAKEIILAMLKPTYTTNVLFSIEQPKKRNFLHITKETFKNLSTKSLNDSILKSYKRVLFL